MIILFKDIDVGFISHIYAMRLTHTGEDGFMLYIPSEVKENMKSFFLIDIEFCLVCFVCI